MKKYIIALLFACIAAGAANAQRRSTVSGVVVDAETRRGLIGVVVELIPDADSTKSTVIVSGAGGAFSTGLARGEYDVRASLLGYETLRRTGNFTESRHTLDTLYLSQGVRIDAVVSRAVAMRTSVKGDTLIYSADAFKVTGDATVSGLLEKMPGIKVDGGTVEAQGEAVRKVLIDNREFFGEDVAAAISSLPAEAVKNIEVFDKLSDNAEFTGIDDGEGYNNIVTRESMRQGVMGQVSGQYGIEPPENSGGKLRHYGLAGGNVSIFHDQAKITVGGTLNNLNERHFTSEDILGAGHDDGIAKVGRFQFNYIDVLGKKDQWNVDATYSFNITDADAYSTVDREYFPSDDALYSRYSSVTERNTINRHHSFRGRIDWKPNQYQELRIRPILNFQGNDSRRFGSEIYTPVDGTNDIGLDNWRNSNESGYMMALNANYRVRLGKPGRTLSFFFNVDYDPDDRKGESYSERQETNPDGGPVYVRQRTPSFNYDFGIGGGLTYTEPISETSLVNFDYSIRYNYSDQDRKAYLWDEDEEAYFADPEADLSGVYNSGYTIHRTGPGYRMQKGRSTLSVGVFYQYSTLASERVLPMEYNLKQDFNNITYAAMLNTQFESGASIRVFLNSRTRNPGVFDLQDVPDISDVQNIGKGNLDLRPSYGNMLYGRFILPNVQKGRTFSINLGGNYTSNAIVRRTLRESPGFPITDPENNIVETLDAVGTYSESVNMDGQWSARLGVDYGFPVKFLRSNLNLEAGLRYSESPSQIGRWTPDMDAPLYRNNILSNFNPEAEITLGSNISEKVDFRVSYEIGYNRVRNSYSGSGNSEYLDHEIDVDFKFILPANFTLAGNMEYYKYNSISGASFDREYIIANAAIGKKVLRSKLGEVSIFVNDIFNQNIGFRRNFSAQYVQNQINSVIGRYFGVKFAWNIRMFGKNGSQNIDMYHMDDGHSHGGRGGHGHGGGRPF